MEGSRERSYVCIACMRIHRAHQVAGGFEHGEHGDGLLSTCDDNLILKNLRIGWLNQQLDHLF